MKRCRPIRSNSSEAWIARTTFALRRVRVGEALVHAGDKFHSLYVVRSGCFKTVYTDFSGSEQVLGFPMCGDLMGADGIDTGYYGSTAVSLDTSEVVIVPLASLAQLVVECPEFLRPQYEKFWSSIHTAEWWKQHWQKTGLVDVQCAQFLPESDQLLRNYWVERLPDQDKDPIMRAVPNDDERLIGLFCLVARKR